MIDGELNRFKLFPENLLASSGYAVVATSVHGQIERDHDGFYLRQTRFLSRAVLTVDGERPQFVSANPVDPYSLIAYYVAGHGEGERAKKALALQLNRFVGGGMHQDLVVTNHGLAELEVELAWDLDADFADLEEVMEHPGERLQDAPVARRWEGGALRFTYGHPRLPHGTLVRCAGASYVDGRITYRLRLAPRASATLCQDVVPMFLGEPNEPIYGCRAFHSRATAADRVRETILREGARLTTPSLHVQLAWDRAVQDLAALPLLDGEGDAVYAPAAAIPLYQEQYGRDALTTGWQASLLGPHVLKGALEMVGSQLGQRDDPAHDEQPGRVIQQAKRSPLALLGQNPFERYYGDYAGPGMFLVGAGWYFAQTGDRAYIKALLPRIEAVLGWIDRYADPDGDGFYEYYTRQPDERGKNQGWMDSPEALVYEDGRLMPNPIAVAEIQGYYYAAKQLMGLVYLFLGDVARGTDLLAQAADLKRRFNQVFWLPEERCYAQALDPDKRPVRNVASNAGQCLACGIVDTDKAAALAGRLMAPDMFSGWGIRTLSSDHAAFNPFTYHLGSVWPSENGSIALGFKRYGLTGPLHELTRGLFDATRLFDQRRLPEAIGGYARDHDHPHPGIYPQSNAPQSWSASAVVMLVQALAGILPLAPIHTLVVDPDLPDWLPELTLEHVQVGEARVSLRFRRDASGHTDYQVLHKTGKLHVLRQAAPNSVHAGPGDRLGDLLASLVH